MSLTRLFIKIFIIWATQYCVAQTDSVFAPLGNLQKVPVKYLNAVENKMDKYSNYISSKIEKILFVKLLLLQKYIVMKF